MLIAITRADAGLSIMDMIADGDDAAVVAEIAKAGIDAVSWRRIVPEDVPADRSDRDAWTDTGKAIDVDPERKAIIDAAKAAIRDPLAEIDQIKAEIAATNASAPPLTGGVQPEDSHVP